MHLREEADCAFLPADNFAHFSAHVSQFNDDIALTSEYLTQLTVLLGFILFLFIVVLIRVLSSVAKNLEVLINFS